ncbi:MAG: hypothetical protein ACK4RF_08660 [Cyclobacteriaceae bacterium]
MQSKKFRKWLVLFLALVIPACIYIFLKKFGQNQFDVAPLYAEAPPELPGDCPPHQGGPYRIPEFVLESLGWSDSASLFLFLFTEGGHPVGRITEAFQPDELRQVPVNAGNNPVVEADLSWWNACYLFVSEQRPLLLVDKERQIRGHYGNTREDIDRLLMEAAIILRKY